MDQPKTIAQNVLQFIDRASDMYGKMEGERFNQEMFNRFQDGHADSPIEQIFYTAVYAVARFQHEDLDQEPQLHPDTKEWFLPPGLYMQTQKNIGKFRVDFLFEHFPWAHQKEVYAPVIVELDGHAFHDKDKRQRSYEKARDRFFTKQGYRVLHFTGSDIVADPFKAAWEVFDLFGGIGMDEYDPSNPIGEYGA